MRASTPLLLLVGLLACYEESGADDADAAADTAVDTAADTALVGDGTGDGWGQPEQRDGAYQGEIIVVGSAVGMEGTSETCTGTVHLDLAADANPEIDGVATCTFGGWLDWMGEQTLLLTGGSVGEDGAEGLVTVSIEGVHFEQAWSGAWEDEHLSAWFSGSESYELGNTDFEVLFEGSFTARIIEE